MQGALRRGGNGKAAVRGVGLLWGMDAAARTAAGQGMLRLPAAGLRSWASCGNNVTSRAGSVNYVRARGSPRSQTGRRGYAQMPQFAPSAKSFSELRSAAVGIKRRYVRLAVYMSVGCFFVVFPASTLAAQAWEQRHWPTLQAKVIEVQPVENTKKRSVTYRYKVLGRVIEKTQVNWNVPWWDQINNTTLDYKAGDLVTIHHHPHNVMLSVLKPGNFAHPNFGRLKGEVIEDNTKPARRASMRVGQQ